MAWAHSEIDVLDNTLRVSTSVAEGLQGALNKSAGEIAAVEPELREAELQVAQERRAKAFQEFRGQLEQASHQATAALDNARRNLACLHLAAAEGIDKYGIDALRICEVVFAEFHSKQSNLEARGLRRVHAGYQNSERTGVFVQPMR